jgi:hypothetical protein
MKMKRIWWGFLMIASVAFLAGCGGGGGGTSLMVGGDRATQDAIDALQGRATSAEEDSNAANMALGAVRMALGIMADDDIGMAISDLMTGRTNAEGRLSAAEMALGDESTGDLAADVARVAEVARTQTAAAMAAQATLGEVQIALGASSTTVADLNAKVTELETMRDTYKGMVNAVRNELGVAADADQVAILAEIMRLSTSADPFAIAQSARANAMMAAESAEDAVDEAETKSARIDTLSVLGESKTAQANAQAVEDAEVTVMEAVDDAKRAESRLRTARDVDEDAAHSQTLIDALDEAIKIAEDAVETTEDAAKSKVLADAIEDVRGDEDDRDYPTKPADHAKMVAESIGMALGPMSAINGAGTRVMLNSTATRPDAPMKPSDPAMQADPATFVEEDDHLGKTWKQIVGTTVKQRVDRQSAETTHEVDAAKFEDMPVATAGALNVDGERTELDLTAGGGLADGAEHAGNYRGIPGTVFCAGSCAKETGSDEVERLTGEWYFAPDPDMTEAWYIESEDAAGNDIYVSETMYARFGYWVTVVSNVATIHTRAVGGAAGDTGLIAVTNYNLTTLNEGMDATTLTDTKATYTGDAIGISLHKEFDSQGGIVDGTLQSGQFTANVTLDATFGPNARIGGEVDTFEGNAVDSQWEVELLDVQMFDGAFTNGATVASGQDGIWTGQAYGDSAEKRPVGIFGSFNAHFSDGHAAGAYAVRD